MKSLKRGLPATAARAAAAVGPCARRRAYGVFSAPRLPSTYVKLQEPFDLTRAGKKASKEITDPRQAFEEVLTHGSQVFIQSAAATPTPLVNAMCEVAQARNLTGINTMHILLAGPADGPLGAPGMAKHIRMVNFFIGPAHGARAAVNRGDADFIPVFLSEVPLLFRRGVRRVDVALINVSPPDKHGFCSLGVSVDCARSALQVAKVVIAMVNKHQPRTFGDAGIHVSHLDYIWRHDKPLYTAGPRDKDGHADAAIGKIIAEHLVEDGATLQMGIGGVPDAVLANLGNHKDLGVATEMFSDGVLPLVQAGVITGAKKASEIGQISASFALGSQDLYDFIDNNPGVTMLDCAYTNDTEVIRRQPKMTAINSAIEVDLTGQVCADSIGTRMFSGFGGQMDFIHGSALCPDGRPILALPSVTARGESRIVNTLKPGAGVVTSRGHVRYVVTEYGIAELWGKTLRERAAALIAVAHPDHRAELTRQARERCIL